MAHFHSIDFRSTWSISGGLVSCETSPADSQLAQTFAWDQQTLLQTCLKATEFRAFQHQLYCNHMEHKLLASQKQLQEAEARAIASEKRLDSMRQAMDQSHKELANLKSELASKKHESLNLIGRSDGRRSVGETQPAWNSSSSLGPAAQQLSLLRSPRPTASRDRTSESPKIPTPRLVERSENEFRFSLIPHRPEPPRHNVQLPMSAVSGKEPASSLREPSARGPAAAPTLSSRPDPTSPFFSERPSFAGSYPHFSRHSFFSSKPPERPETPSTSDRLR